MGMQTLDYIGFCCRCLNDIDNVLKIIIVDIQYR